MVQLSRVGLGVVFFAVTACDLACSGSDQVSFGDAATSSMTPPGNGNDKPGTKKDAGVSADATAPIDAGNPGDDDDDDTGDDDADAAPPIDPPDAADSGPAPLPPATAAQLLALTQHCDAASNGNYASYTGGPNNVVICRLNGAYHYTTGMHIDCDGQSKPECAKAPNRGSGTAVAQSDGRALDPVHIPFIVLPEPSATFNYKTADIKEGAVVVVLYNGQMAYGIFGDTGATDTIGSASYGMAQALGINPDPVSGGVPNGVSYIVFTGAQAVTGAAEDHQAAVTLGQTLAAKLVATN